MKRMAIVGTACVACLLMLLASSCGHEPSTAVRQLVDSLNTVAYTYRYRDIDVSRRAAQAAYQASEGYAAGRAEACNHLGFVAFACMEYEEARAWHERAADLTLDELERLASDIGLMRICQRASLNKEFHDNRTRAEARRARIDGEWRGDDDSRRAMRRRSLYAECSLVSAAYHHTLRQWATSADCLHEIDVPSLRADTALCLCYDLALAILPTEGQLPADQERLDTYDRLTAIIRAADAGGFTGITQMTTALLATRMAEPAEYEFYRRNRPLSVIHSTLNVDTLLPLNLLQDCLSAFDEAGHLRQAIEARISMAEYLNLHGCYRAALDTLSEAIEQINLHHARLYPSADSTERLSLYDRRDTVCCEKRWLAQGQLTVPTTIARLRQQLSMSYAGLGEKEYSDYNRNAYLDILDDTRQDKEWESRFLTLQREAARTNRVLWVLGVCVLLTVLLFVVLNRWSSRRIHRQVEGLGLVLDVCRQITRSLPDEPADEEAMRQAMLQKAGDGLRRLLRTDRVEVVDGSLHAVCPGREQRALLSVLNPYVRWTLEHGRTSLRLSNERGLLEKELYVSRQHLADNKRQNMVKRTCFAIVSGIFPYIDRITRELRYLNAHPDEPAEQRQARYDYIRSLVAVINEQNDILTLWVRLKQGALSLNVETFALNELFDILQKSSGTFAMKGLSLNVLPTDILLKADKALTMFMLNTLADNARKYTPAGGSITVSAQTTADGVEISVADTGVGLTAEQQAQLMGRTLTDGHGFGLLNCRGIVEQYRKTGPLFHCCMLGVESEPGKGSRFFFRLPAGVKRALTVVGLTCLLAGGLCSCAHGPAGEIDVEAPHALPDNYEALLDSAALYADAAYYSNLDGHYAYALQYADSALMCLNQHYATFGAGRSDTMALLSDHTPAELSWWSEPFDTDFHIILDVRNEAAVAALALRQWERYAYNDDAYAGLYKLLSEDTSIDDFYAELRRQTGNKTVGICLSVLLLLLSSSGFYFVYIRKRLQERWNLEQVLEINRAAFAASLPVEGPETIDPQTALTPETDEPEAVVQRIVHSVYAPMNELFGIRFVGIYVEVDGRQQGLSAGAGEDIADDWTTEAKRNLSESPTTASRGSTYTHGFTFIPLMVEEADGGRKVGTLCVQMPASSDDDAHRLLLQLVAGYMAIVVEQAVVRRIGSRRDTDDIYDELTRSRHEDNTLHVQNLVLDNCLSTIKHETIYYPGKIAQLVGRLCRPDNDPTTERETLQSICELTDYYRGVFSLLSRRASRQMEQATFRRTAISVGDLMDDALRYFRRRTKGRSQGPTLTCRPTTDIVAGDLTLLRFLTESLIDEALSYPLSGALSLAAEAEGQFVCFRFTDRRRQLTADQLSELFYPKIDRLTADRNDPANALCPKGAEYLLCKQIIREHDEHAGRRGCRINAYPEDEGGGFTVYFTLPMK